MKRVAYEREAGRYQKARGMSLEAIAPWRDAVQPWVADVGGLPILDAGAGTGQFARAFAAWFASRVVALEPSSAMRQEARRADDDARILWLGGRAEVLPLAARSCGAAWLSTVIHHIPDLARCARELGRVLADRGPVLVRSAFAGRDHGITLLRFFPGARRTIARFPSVEQVADDFARAGFVVHGIGEVAQTSAPSLRDFRDRVAIGRHADSLLAGIEDDEFARGLATLDEAVAVERVPTPVRDRLTLLVLLRR